MRRTVASFILFASLCVTASAHVETIAFADTLAKRLCVEMWDSDGDGELSYQEAAAVTTLGNTFCLRLLQSPSTFDELRYFTSLSEVESRAFTDCYHLQHVTLPASVMAIREKAFWSCVELQAINIPTSTQRLGHSCFVHCSSLREVVVPPSVRDSIPYQAFAYCSELQTADIEANVQVIGAAAFKGCTLLRKVVLPYTTTRICDSAFSGCEEIRQLFCHAVSPPALFGHIFEEKVLQHAVLFVPAGCVEAYKKAPGWRDFKFIAEMLD